MMEFPRKKLKLADYSQQLWELNVCVSCAKPLNSSSKLLSCLHGVCSKCVELHFDIRGQYVCKCTIATDISKELPNCTLLCEKFDEGIIRNNYMEQEYQKKLYGKYMTKAPCPNCDGKYIEVYCTACNQFHCSMCQLMSHRFHNYKPIDIVMEEIRSNLMNNKVDLCEKLQFLNQAKSNMPSNINALNMHKLGTKKEIFESFSVIRDVFKKAEDKLLGYVDSYYEAEVENLTKNTVALDGLTKKYDFYLNFSESALKKENNVDLDITNLINNQLLHVGKCFIEELSGLSKTNTNIDLKVKFNDTLNQLADSVGRLVIYKPFEKAIDTMSQRWNITSSPDYRCVNKIVEDIPKVIDDHAMSNIIKFNRIRLERKSCKSFASVSSHSDATPIDKNRRILSKQTTEHKPEQ